MPILFGSDQMIHRLKLTAAAAALVIAPGVATASCIEQHRTKIDRGCNLRTGCAFPDRAGPSRFVGGGRKTRRLEAQFQHAVRAP